MDIIFHPLAQIDIRKAREFYNERQSGLGFQFAQDVIAGLERLKEYPQAYIIVAPPAIRGCKLQRFKDYSIIYEMLSDREIFIYSVFSWKRDPNDLMSRLP